jgi:broad specificity phosphatase PhoE
MSEIYFVRHGQASLGAKNYDKLSDLGWQQARWLGEHYRRRGLSFDRIIVGDMRRHKETLQGISEGMELDLEPMIDPRLNEFKFFPVLSLYQRVYQPDSPPLKTAAQFFAMLRTVMEAWIAGELDDALKQQDEGEGTVTESWTQFNQRVVEALTEARSEESEKKALIVSSGGPKSLAMKHVLDLSDDATIELMMQIRNTASTQFLSANERMSLKAFNVLSHMEQPDRSHAITMV